jgi:hypothetical protein
MLLPREQSPWNCSYFLGAIALEAMVNSTKGKLDLPELQRTMSSNLGKEVSPTQVLAAVAWLFLLDAIELDEDGRLVKCS